jgi:hypothetical protein
MKAVADLVPVAASGRSSSKPSTIAVSAVRLVAVSDEASAALGEAFIRIASFPFKIGRESRALNPLTRAMVAVERRISTAPQLNDVYLIETPTDGVVHISRQHCTIDRLGTGFLLLDRNSMCGTGIVRSRLPLDANQPFVERIGAGTPTDRTLLYDGDLVIVGNEDSPYVFRFELESASV